MDHIVHNEVGPSMATGLSSHNNDTDDDRMIALVLSEEYEKLDGAVARRLANLASVPVCLDAKLRRKLHAISFNHEANHPLHGVKKSGEWGDHITLQAAADKIGIVEGERYRISRFSLFFSLFFLLPSSSVDTARQRVGMVEIDRYRSISGDNEVETARTGGTAQYRWYPTVLQTLFPSTIEGEDHSILRHRWTPLKLPPPAMPSSVVSIAIIRCFLRYRSYHSQLPLSLLLLSVASFVVVIVLKFLHHCCPLFLHFPLLVTLFSPSNYC
ncbi:hypothetical protein BHM03_00026177 [Ensete ventricosum]|uniref:Uncharacterized protein n=1 Tax=Ensete ventricosum TaxID=4639 RepID=A0A445MHC3_ENSVE|nr:hypothetical protein BHM03_00026177 [Ensete ventricosum]